MLCGSHIKIWNLANHMKKQNKKHQNLLVKNWKIRVWCSLFCFFHVICKISNLNMWAAKHLTQASCTELTLHHPSNYFKGLMFNFKPDLGGENEFTVVVLSYWGRARETQVNVMICKFSFPPNSNSWYISSLSCTKSF